MILSSLPEQLLNKVEVGQLKLAITFWFGVHQRDRRNEDIYAARQLKRRLETVHGELRDDHSWRFTGLDVRTHNLIKEALQDFPSFISLKEKFCS